MADKKHDVTDADIRALVLDTDITDLEGFQFEDLKVRTLEDKTVSAQVFMRNQNEERVTLTALGQGSVEAIFNAVDQFFKQEVRLERYLIEAVTEGIDAQASVHVTVENLATNTLFNATGIDFDVLKASAEAYINANTLVQKENAGLIGHRLSEKD